LLCAPDAAAARLGRLTDPGFDETVVVMPRGAMESDFGAFRALLPV
jgi:hypothetical protein